MINVIITNTSCRIDGVLPIDIVSMLDDNCSYDVSGAHFSSKVQQGLWDGRRHLFSRTTFSFPTGLLSRVKQMLTSAGVGFTLTDQRLSPALGSALTSTVPPWDWQEGVIDTCIKEKRGIIRAATGSGKSVCELTIFGRLNIPTVILTYKRDIMYQMKDVIKKLYPGLEPGQIGNGLIEPKHITVAMIQTIANAYKLKIDRLEEKDKTKLSTQTALDVRRCVESAQMEIADEVHGLTSPGVWYQVQKCFKSAYYRTGWSATDYRTDGSDILMEAAFGPRIINISCSELISKGFLAKPTFYLVNFKHPKAPACMDWGELYTREIVENEERNFLIVKLGTRLWKEGRHVLVMVTQRRHGELLEAMFGLALGKANVKYMHGDSDTEERRQTLKDLDSGKIRLVIATKIYGEGVDVRGLDTIINVKAQESQVDFIQIVGRAMRKTETKDKATIFDIQDYGCRWLAAHSKARKDILLEEPLFTINEIDSEKV